MTLRSLTIQVPEEQFAALETAATVQHRDRNDLVTDAVDQYLSLDAYHRELIEEGIRQAEAGEVVDHDSVKQMVTSWFGKLSAF